MVMVCEWFGLKTTRMVFVGLASKSVTMVSSGLALKSAAMVSSGLASKSATTVSSGLASKPAVMVFSSLASKMVVMISPGLASKPVVGFLVEPKNQGGGGFPDLGLKTGSFGLVILVSKSPRQFLDLGLKTKWASVCRLRHKTDGSHVEASLDMISPFGLKTDGVAMSDDEWCTWHYRGGCVGGKLKTDGSMRRAASDSATLPLLFSMY
jgi:hypothetical protein